MAGVQSQSYYCLHSEQTRRVLPCGDKPPKKDMSRILAKVMVAFESQGNPALTQSIHYTAKQVWLKQPSVDWQLLLLA